MINRIYRIRLKTGLHCLRQDMKDLCPVLTILGSLTITLVAPSLVWVTAATARAAFDPEPIRFRGVPVEMIVSEVSEHTLRLELKPVHQPGSAPTSATAVSTSTVLAPLHSEERFRSRLLAHVQHLQFGQLRLVIRSGPLTISILRPDGKLVQELVFEKDMISFRTDAPVLGLGEGSQQFDRRGAFYPMINGQVAPWLATHGATIPVPFLIGTDGWALFVHSPWGEFDLREGKGRFLPSNSGRPTEPLDLFVISAPEPADVMAEYIQLTGRPAMPPKWTLGYLQSHRTLSGPHEPLEIAETFRRKNLPCDGLIYLGTGYCTNGWNTGHGSFAFNPDPFPHPAEQIQALHALNFKMVLHINHVPKDLFGGAISEDSQSPVHIRNYWERHRQLVELGVDGWWPDDGDELPLESRLARHRCYYEGPLLDRTNVRPWSLHRNGFAGAARYGGWIWSGDTLSQWATLAAHVPVGINHSLSLTPFWGSDTGGFVPTPELTGELYIRWFQFSTFNPLFRSHGRTWHLRLPWGWDTGLFGPIEATQGPDPAELNNAQVEPICRKYLELRYRLLPYNYTLLREACDTGLPPMRALWLHYPSDPEAIKLGDEYLWGRDLLVAPVVEKGAKSRRLYLPKGTWYDWWTGEKLDGPQWFDRPVDLATLPLYVRAGSVVPLDPLRQYTSEPITEPTLLHIYPGEDCVCELYEDDGVSLDYLRGKARWLRFQWRDQDRNLIIEPDPRSKDMPFPARKFAVVLTSTGAHKTVEFNGRRVSMRF